MASDVRLRGGDKTDEKTFQGENVKSGLLPGVLIGETKVWRNGKETITEVEGLFPEGLTSVLDSSKELSSSWRVSAWRVLSSVAWGEGRDLCSRPPLTHPRTWNLVRGRRVFYKHYLILHQVLSLKESYLHLRAEETQWNPDTLPYFKFIPK